MGNPIGREDFEVLIKFPAPTGPRGGDRDREKAVIDEKWHELWEGTAETIAPRHSTQDRSYGP